MARLARVVVPGIPHHVTQRGNGRARTFFNDQDFALYRDLLAEHCRITTRAPIRSRFPCFADLVASDQDAADLEPFARLRAAESIGRPLGDERFPARIERMTKRDL
jgi:hypothetical protein